MADNEKSENEFVEKAEVVLKSIKLELGENQEIRRIRFITDKGDITWKPFLMKTKWISGFDCTVKESMSFDDVPKKLKKWANEIQDEGQMKVKVSYAIFKKEVDGEMQQYRYISSEKTFDSWEEI